jgi:hypothetical protein
VVGCGVGFEDWREGREKGFVCCNVVSRLPVPVY